MLAVLFLPFQEHSVRNAVSIMDLFKGHGMGKTDFQDLKDKGKGVLPVRDNEIGEYCVRMATGADDTLYYKLVIYDLAIYDIYDIPLIGRVESAQPFGMAGWTAFIGNPELVHEQ